MKNEYAVMSVVNVQIDEEDLSTLLANACADVCGFSGAKEKDRKSYNAAKKQLIAEGAILPCVEDIWARMLLNGGSMEFTDPEDGREIEVNIHDIAKAVIDYGNSHVASDLGPSLKAIAEDGDFYDADAVIQFAMYGNVIYG